MPAPAYRLPLLMGAVLALIVLGWADALVAADLGPLLARIERAYGNGSPPASIVQRGWTVSEVRGEGSLTRAYRGPESFRIEIRYSDSIETRIVDGAQAWQRSRPMNDAFRSALLLQAARVALPWNLLSARENLRDVGEHAIGEGLRLHFIELPLANGLKLVVEVDPESGLIRRTRGMLPSPNGNEMVFGTIYEDFRSVGGRRYAAIEHHFAMGRYMGRSHIDSVEFDVPLSDALFRPEIPGMI